MSTATQGVKTILHPVTDVEKAKPVYTALLGVEPAADAPYYVGNGRLVATFTDPDGNVLGLIQDR